MNKIKKILPGLLLSILIAFIAKIIEIFIPLIGAPTGAIFLGIIFGNLFFKKELWVKGEKFSESKFLEFSVFLLGLTITFANLTELGILSILYIFLQIVGIVLFIYYFGKKLGFSKKFNLLMASGNGICGSSAIAATSDTIEASEEEKSITITLVNLLGTVLMLTLPIISFYLFNNNTFYSSALIGGVLQSVGQVVASGKIINDKIVDISLIFKMMRILFLVLVVLIFGYITKKDQQKQKKINTNDKLLIKKGHKFLIPWYVLGFIVCCILKSNNLINNNISNIAHDFSSYLEIIALAAIGLKLKIKVLINQGQKIFYYLLGIGIFQTSLSLLLINLLFR